VVDLDAIGSTDPDGDDMIFDWSLYPLLPGVPAVVKIEGRDTRRALVVIAPEWAGTMIPILLTVTDRGHPSLTRYGRVLIMGERTEENPERTQTEGRPGGGIP
jgi:hypothetical protein